MLTGTAIMTLRRATVGILLGASLPGYVSDAAKKKPNVRKRGVYLVVTTVLLRRRRVAVVGLLWRIAAVGALRTVDTKRAAPAHGSAGRNARGSRERKHQTERGLSYG